MKVFVIDFADTNRISLTLEQNHHVFTEKKDGQVAYQKIGELMPDVIFVNYCEKPSHGRQTIQAVLKRKKTSFIPIYFVDGTATDNAKIGLLGQVIRFEEIENCLSQVPNTGPGGRSGTHAT